MIVNIEKLDHQGRGIAFLNKPIFIDNALPDELVDIKIIKETSKYFLGEVIKYIKLSDKRIKPKCKYYGICGGCQLMHMLYDNQLIYKENKVNDIINRYLKKNVKIDKIIPSAQFNYRNKAVFKAKDNIGYYKIRSNDIVDVDKCLLVDHKINAELKKIKIRKIKNIDEIIVRTGINTINNYDSDNVIMKLNDYSFNVSNDSFFQVNTKTTIKLYDKILEYLDLSKEDKVLDLYCGVGSIGIYISSYCDRVYGIEINESAILNANKNKLLNKIDNIEFKCLNANNIKNMHYNANKVIVDPPRNGLDKKTIEYLNDGNFAKIVYVSCNPITLVRDLKELSKIYNIDRITPVDMFPNTYHVECVCVLNRR